MFCEVHNLWTLINIIYIMCIVQCKSINSSSRCLTFNFSKVWWKYDSVIQIELKWIILCNLKVTWLSCYLVGNPIEWYLKTVDYIPLRLVWSRSLRQSINHLHHSSASAVAFKPMPFLCPSAQPFPQSSVSGICPRPIPQATILCLSCLPQ